jgi:hypothetical protein
MPGEKNNNQPIDKNSPNLVTLVSTRNSGMKNELKS